MKKTSIFTAAAVLMCGSLLTSSCIGSFSLFNKYSNWQAHMTSNKYVNGIVGFILQWIVGPICIVVDGLVLNTIEFWSGTNPIAENTRMVKGEDGLYYAVRTTRQGYEITAPTGEVTRFVHDEKNDSWSIVENGATRELFRYNADGTLTATTPAGQELSFTPDAAGMQEAQSVFAAAGTYAMR